MQSILQNGPVIAITNISQEMLLLDDGVFQIDSQINLPGHQLFKIVGWGQDDREGEEPIRYWIVQSSFGDDWAQ